MITARPLNFVDINNFTYAEVLDLIQGNAITCYLQMFKDTTRYIPLVGATLQVTFPRALTVAATPANQDVTVGLSVVDVRDYSVYMFSLTAAQVNAVASGGVKVTITIGGVASVYPVDSFVRKTLVMSRTGCTHG